MNRLEAPMPATVDQFLQAALRLAEDNARSGRGGPFGAVVVKDGAVIAEGVNLVTGSCDPTAHAEVMAIREACRKLQTFELSGCTLYASCEPCPMCLAAAYWARVDRLVFAATRDDAARAGFDDELLYRELPLAPDERSLPTAQLLRAEAAVVFAEWLAKEDRVLY
jgi:guanine deaminase